MDLNKLEALAQAAEDASDRSGTSLTAEWMAFSDECTPTVIRKLIDLIHRQEEEIIARSMEADGLKVRADMLAAELLAAQQATIKDSSIVQPVVQEGTLPVPHWSKTASFSAEQMHAHAIAAVAAGQAGSMSDEQIMRMAGDLKQRNAGVWPGEVAFARAVLAASQPVAPVQAVLEGWRELIEEVANYAPVGKNWRDVLRDMKPRAAALIAAAPAPGAAS